MNVADLELLVAVVEAGSFRRAAQAKYLDVATLSRRIARLEDELGVLLLERGRAGVKPTVTGLSTLRLARKAIADMEAIRRNAAANGRAERGTLRLGTHLSTIGPNFRALLKAWRDQHPDVALEFTEIDDRALLIGMREREVSAIVSFCPVLPAEVATQQLWNERLLVASPVSHPLANAERIGWSEMRSLPLLVRSWCGSNAYHELQARLVGPGADFRSHVAGMFNLLNMVAIGEGAVFAMDYHREMAVEGIVLRSIDEPDATIPVALAWDPQSEDPVTGSFVAFIRDQTKAVGSQPCASASRTPDPSP